MEEMDKTQEQFSQPNASVVTVGDWIVTMILMCIPLVNLIMVLIWAFGSNTPVSKANWAKATLLFMVIGVVLMMIFGASIFALVGSSMAF